MKKQCEICGTRKYVNVYKSEVFGKVCICNGCILENDGVKNTINAYELGNIVLVRK